MAGAATGLPGQRCEDATSEQRADQTVEGLGRDVRTGDEETVTEEASVEGSRSDSGEAVGGGETTHERFVSGPEQGTQDMPSGRASSEAATTEAEDQRIEESTREGQPVEESREGQPVEESTREGEHDAVGGGEQVQGAKDKLEEESQEGRAMEDKLRGRVRDWMKRDQ